MRGVIECAVMMDDLSNHTRIFLQKIDRRVLAESSLGRWGPAWVVERCGKAQGCAFDRSSSLRSSPFPLTHPPLGIMSLPTLPTPQEYAEVLGLQPGPHAVVSALIVGDALDRCERMVRWSPPVLVEVNPN